MANKCRTRGRAGSAGAAWGPGGGWRPIAQRKRRSQTSVGIPGGGGSRRWRCRQGVQYQKPTAWPSSQVASPVYRQMADVRGRELSGHGASAFAAAAIADTVPVAKIMSKPLASGRG